MSQKSGLSLLETAIQEQLKAEEIEVRVVKQIRWQLSKIPEVYKVIDDVGKLAKICLQYIELIIRFVDSSNTLDSLSFALNRVEVFKYFNPLIEVGRMRGLGNEFVKMSANSILDRIVNDPSLKNVCGKGILHYLRAMIQNVDTSVQEAIASSHSQIYVYKLADMLTDCGDYEYQTIILEVIIRMMSQESIVESANEFFPEVESLQYALCRIDRNEFDKSSRTFLNTLNAIHSNVFSIVADKIYLDKMRISGPVLGSQHVRHKLWVDFNKNVSTIGIFCDRDSLRTVPPSEDSTPAASFGWELITISCSDVKNIRIKRLESGTKKSTTTFSFEMRQQLHVLFVSSEPMTHSKLITLWVSCEKDAQKLKTEILPKLFPEKHGAASMTPSYPRSNVGVPPVKSTGYKRPGTKSIASESRSMKSLCDYITVKTPQRPIGKSSSKAAVSQYGSRSLERSVRQLSPDSTVPEVKDELFECSTYSVREEYYKPPHVVQGMKVKSNRRLNVTASYRFDSDTRQDSGLTEDEDEDDDNEIVEESLLKSVLQEIEVVPLPQEHPQAIENSVKLASDEDGNKENLCLPRMTGISLEHVDRMLRLSTESENLARMCTPSPTVVPKKQIQVARKKMVRILSTIDSCDTDLEESTPTEQKLKEIFLEEPSTKRQPTPLEPGSPKTTQEVIDILSRTPEDREMTPKINPEEEKITPKTKNVQKPEDELDEVIPVSESLKTPKKKIITSKPIPEETKITSKIIPEEKIVETEDDESNELIPVLDFSKAEKKKKIAPKTIPEESKITPKIVPEEKIVETADDESNNVIPVSDPSKTSKRKKRISKTTDEEIKITSKIIPEENIVEKADDESNNLIPVSDPSKTLKKKKRISKTTDEEIKITSKIIPEENIVEKADDESNNLIPVSDPSKTSKKKTRILKTTDEEIKITSKIIPEENIVEKADDESNNLIPVSDPSKTSKKKTRISKTTDEEIKITSKIIPEENIAEKADDESNNLIPVSDPSKTSKKKKRILKTTNEEIKITSKIIPEENIVEKADDESNNLIPVSDPSKTSKKKKRISKTTDEEIKITSKIIPEENIVEKADDESNNLIPVSDPSKTSKKKKRISKTTDEEIKITSKIIPEENIVEKAVDESNNLIPVSDPSKTSKKKKRISKTTDEEIKITSKIIPEENIVEKADNESNNLIPVSDRSKTSKKKKRITKTTDEEIKITSKIIPEENIIEKADDESNNLIPVSDPSKTSKKKKRISKTTEISDEESEDLIPASVSPKAPRNKKITPKTITRKEKTVEKPNEQQNNSYVVKLDEIVPVTSTPKMAKKKKVTPKTTLMENVVENIVEKPVDRLKKYVVNLDEVVPVREPTEPLKPPKEKKKSPRAMDPFVFGDLSHFRYVAEEQDLSTLYLSRLKDLEPEVPATKIEMLSKRGVNKETKVLERPKKRLLYQAPEELQLTIATKTGDVDDITTDATHQVEKAKGRKTRRGREVQVSDEEHEVTNVVEIPTEVPNKRRKRRAVQEITENVAMGPKHRKLKTTKGVGPIEPATSQNSVEEPKLVAPRVQEKKTVGTEMHEVNLDNYEIPPEIPPEMSKEVTAPWRNSESSSEDEGPKIITTVAQVHVMDDAERRKLKQLPKRKVNYRLFPKLDYDAIELADDYEKRERLEKNRETTTKDSDINASSTVVQQPARFPRQAAAVATTLITHLATAKSDKSPDSPPEPEPRKKRKYTRRADKKTAAAKGKSKERKKLDKACSLDEQEFQQYLDKQDERCPEKARKRTNKRQQIDDNETKLQYSLITLSSSHFNLYDDDLPDNKDLDRVKFAMEQTLKLERTKLKAQRRKSTHRSANKTLPARLNARPKKYQDNASRLFDEMMEKSEHSKRETTHTSNLTPAKSRYSDAVARFGDNDEEDSVQRSKSIRKRKTSSESSSDLPDLEVEVVKRQRYTPDFLRTVIGSSDKEGEKSPPTIVGAPPVPICSDVEDIPDVREVSTLKLSEVAGSPPKRPRIRVLQNIMLKPADAIANKIMANRYIAYRNQLQSIGVQAKNLKSLYENEPAIIEKYTKDMNVLKDIVSLYDAYEESTASLKE